MNAKLRLVKVVHTLAWAFFAGCIVAIPVLAACGQFRLAWWAIGIVALEVLVLAANGMVCPLTAVAARYTDERAANFDIYLPRWLARWNKHIFGSLYVLGILLTLLLFALEPGV
ncbi:MAG: hypothetical protein V4631_17905 [Pseudomonadota bacterium]